MNKFYKNINLNMPERFLHICSLSHSDIYDMYPCANDVCYEKCNIKCNKELASTEFKFLNRVECIYRIARLHWIKEIIDLANNNDSNITSWDEIEFDKKRNKICKHYIRYECGKDDFLIILKKEVKKKGKCYKFISAFPLFLKRDKCIYTQAYEKSQKI